MSIREPRFITSVLLIGGGLFAVLRGMTIIGYSWASFGAAQPDRLQAYADAPGVGDAAREALAGAAASPVQAREALQRAVAGRPMSAALWLALAQADLESGQPLDKVLAAAAMSSVTGPNEGGLMAGRAVFLVPLWPQMPVDMRRTTVDELMQAWSLVAAPERRAMAASIATFEEGERVRLQAALIAGGVRGTDIARELHLEAATANSPD